MKDFNVELEAVRGWCASIVLLGHLTFYSNLLVPKFFFTNEIINYCAPGPLMVRIFFMISGYVIGLQYLDKSDFIVGEYLKRRLIRLYPIYLLAILLTIVSYKENYKTLLNNVFFCQNLFSGLLKGNMPTWSLNHEMVYYILAIPILISKSIFKWVIILLLSFTLFIFFGFKPYAIVEAYIVGFIFWLSGFAINFLTKNLVKPEKILNKIQFKSVFALLLLSLCFGHFNLFGAILEKIPVMHGVNRFPFDNMIKVEDFGVYPYCMAVLLNVVLPKSRFAKFLSYFVYTSCWMHFIYIFSKGSVFQTDQYLVPVFFLFISTFLFLSSNSVAHVTLKPLSYLGKISYAMYLVHMPFLPIIALIPIKQSQTAIFLLRSSIWIVTVVLLSHFLERIIQPYIRSVMNEISFLKRKIKLSE